MSEHLSVETDCRKEIKICGKWNVFFCGFWNPWNKYHFVYKCLDCRTTKTVYFQQPSLEHVEHKIPQVHIEIIYCPFSPKKCPSTDQKRKRNSLSHTLARQKKNACTNFKWIKTSPMNHINFQTTLCNLTSKKKRKSWQATVFAAESHF